MPRAAHAPQRSSGAFRRLSRRDAPLGDDETAAPTTDDRNTFGIPEYDRKILRLQRAYVERFSPGRYLRVDAPHFMEVAIPERITQELRRVIAAADTGSGSTN